MGSRTVRVEVCVSGLAGARAAAAAGADRIELCTALPLGGLTPSLGLVASVRAEIDLPLVALLRPREGDFRYTADDRAAMLRDIRAFGAVGVDALAIGALVRDERGGGERLDQALLEALAETARDAGVTSFCLHRAFDHVADPEAALEAAIALGFDRILTSGCAASAPDGSGTIAALVARAAGRIEIIPAGGVTAESAPALVAATGVRWVHLSAGRWSERTADAPRARIPLGAGARPDEDRHFVTDPDRLRALLRALDAAEDREND